jgi:hypothetical protein
VITEDDKLYAVKVKEKSSKEVNDDELFQMSYGEEEDEDEDDDEEGEDRTTDGGSPGDNAHRGKKRRGEGGGENGEFEKQQTIFSRGYTLGKERRAHNEDDRIKLHTYAQNTNKENSFLSHLKKHVFYSAEEDNTASVARNLLV